ncbi:alpha-methylacyl-CoA racemase-like isoform X5 [Scylla paramamosain]
MALRGLRVVEMAGLAPAPFCGMIMADFGANVIRIDKTRGPDQDRLGRGKRSLALDLKKPEGVNVARRLCSNADVLIEPFRRGLLSMLGRKGAPPTPPINLLADFAGGGLMCALGISLALLERSKSGKGQVIDANMVEGAAYVGSWIYSSQGMFLWGKPRGENWLDSGAHFYDTYETSDGRHMAVGAIEPQFYEELISLLGLDAEEVGQFDEPEEMKKIIAARFKERTQAEWSKVFEGKDACVTPVLSMEEAPHHPHNVARNSFIPSVYSPDTYEPRPAPILSRTPATLPPGLRAPQIGEHTIEILTEAGYSKAAIEELLAGKIVADAKKKAKL